MKNMIQRIFEQESFLAARDVVFKYINEKSLTGNDVIKVLRLLESIVETPQDVIVMFEFYEQIGDNNSLLRYVEECPFRDNMAIKSKRIKILKQNNELSDAWDILDTQNDSEYSLVQRAALMRKDGNFFDARKIIEKAMLKYKINGYMIRTYAAIINAMLKEDERACRLAIPSLARDCIGESISSFDFKRLLAKLIEYESHKKAQLETTKKILAKYEKLKG